MTNISIILLKFWNLNKYLKKYDKLNNISKSSSFTHIDKKLSTDIIY